MCDLVLKSVSFFVGLLFFSAASANDFTISVNEDVDVNVRSYSAQGRYLIVWFAPEYGFNKGHQLFAQALAKKNIEVWHIDISESLFVPRSTGLIKKLGGDYIPEIISHAHMHTRKKIVLAGDAYAAISVLSGAHQWQEKNYTDKETETDYFVGALLFSPYIYATRPSLGLPPQFMPVASASNIPVMIYQAKGSANIVQFSELLSLLRTYDAPIYHKLLPDVMSLFYEEEPTEKMLEYIASLPDNVSRMLPVLDKHVVPKKPIKLKNVGRLASGVDTELKEYKGKIQPVGINLRDVNHRSVIKEKYKGQITVINFWATWCPPCVEEIPSLNRLQKKMQGKAFELISINYAEEQDVIESFMQEVNVEFPVLLDQQGDFAKQWGVIAYPSTFIIDASGEIRYGANAAIEWDDPEVIKVIENLLAKK